MAHSGQEMQACSCENSACKHFRQVCFQPIPAGTGARALYVGEICDECAKLMDKDYLFPPHGTAGTTPGIPAVTEEDRRNYDSDTPSKFADPGDFLKVGDKVRAKFRIWDQPNMPATHTTNGHEWGWVTAEKGEVGVCEHAEPGRWPFVRFENGNGSDVTDLEVEKIS